MSKFIAIVLVVITIAVLFVGCANVEDKTVDGQQSMFVKVEKTTTFLVVYHKETKVMYAVSLGGYNAGNFTLLVNADGTPMLWEG